MARPLPTECNSVSTWMNSIRSITGLSEQKQKRRKRRYVSRQLGVAGFFAALNEAKIDYAVLRWFETLPDLEPGEDIDLLVSDNDLDAMDSFFTGRRGNGIPCDVYSVSGLPGSDHRSVPYFPPQLSSALLQSAVMLDNNVRTPNDYFHLVSMAYHAIFHKGHDSGLPVKSGDAIQKHNPEHDYAAVLETISDKAQIPLKEVSLSGLMAFLESENWLPPIDTMEKLAVRNLWLREQYFSDISAGEEWEGFAVFVVREKGVPHLDIIRDTIGREGFNIIHEEPVDPEQLGEIKQQIRGGNWNRGPWPKSGGDPAHAIYAVDLFPDLPTPETSGKRFSLTNARIPDAKARIRTLVNQRFEAEDHCNVIHSSDNEKQALHYRSLLSPSGLDEKKLKRSIAKLKKQVELPWKEITRLSGHGRRAIVREVEDAGQRFICKTFRPGAERFLKREQLARELADGLPEVVPIIEQKGLHLLFPKLEPEGADEFLSRDEIYKVKELILHYRKLGYELIDFKPTNLIKDHKLGLGVVDFEFMQKAAPNSTTEGCYCWYQVPAGSDLEVPFRKKSQRSNYDRFWLKSTGMPRWMAEGDFHPVIVSFTQAAFGLRFSMQTRFRKLRHGLRTWRRERRAERKAARKQSG